MNAHDPIAQTRRRSWRAPARRRSAYERAWQSSVYDRAAEAAAWAIMEPTRNKALAELVGETTGLGNVPDKITKEPPQDAGSDARHQGAARPMASSPTTPTRHHRDRSPHWRDRCCRALDQSGCDASEQHHQRAEMRQCHCACRRRPKVSKLERLLEYIHAEFDKIGLDRDLVQMIPAPGSKEQDTEHCWSRPIWSSCTGSQNNVHRA